MLGDARRGTASVHTLLAALITAPIAALLALSVVAAGGWSVPAAAAYSSQPAPTWVPNGVVKAMVRSGGVVYLGGSFTSLSDPVTGASATRNRVAALDAATGALLPWNPNANGLVDAIAVAPDGTTVYLGGDFTTVGGATANRLAAVTPLGTRVPKWSASANSTVHDLYADATSLYLGGRFGAVNGKNRPKLARLDRLSGALTSFNAAVTGGRVLTIEPAADGSLLVGGDFTAVGGKPRPFVAGVALDTGAPTAWNPAAVCGTCNVWDLTATAGSVYAAVGGPGGRAVSWDATNGSLTWSRSGDGNVQAIDVQDGVVYAGGHFGPVFDGTTRHQLATLKAGTGDLLDYTVAFVGNDHPGIWALDADADGLRIAGGFVLNGNPAARYAALPLVPPTA